MPKEAKSQYPMNPLDFWQQWSEITTSMWANTLNNGKAAGMDSSGFESLQMKATNAVQEYITKAAQALLDPQAACKLWLDTTMDVWHDAINMSSDSLGLMAGWVKVMEKSQERAHSGEPLPVDPFTLFQEWYNATSEPWSRIVGNIIASERFLAFASPLLEQQSLFISTWRRTSEAYCKLLQLPTLSDIARVAELVVDLEEKVDTLEETIEHVQEQTEHSATTTSRIAALEQRLNQIETKLERMLTLLEKVETKSGGDSAASLS